MAGLELYRLSQSVARKYCSARLRSVAPSGTQYWHAKTLYTKHRVGLLTPRRVGSTAAVPTAYGGVVPLSNTSTQLITVRPWYTWLGVHRITAVMSLAVNGPVTDSPSTDAGAQHPAGDGSCSRASGSHVAAASHGASAKSSSARQSSGQPLDVSAPSHTPLPQHGPPPPPTAPHACTLTAAGPQSGHAGSRCIRSARSYATVSAHPSAPGTDEHARSARTP
mmetsp:Transcript_23822/g.49828  ORF Transcript_23822/g.49828 Transcript_23822/m.49828 type:complete len:222 (-) Transcript_23822:246-911(-)